MDSGSLLSNHSSDSEESVEDTPRRDDDRNVLWEVQTERRHDLLQLIDDDRILERIHRTSNRICPCFVTNVYREHIQVPVDSIASMEAAYGQQAKTGRALAAILLCSVGVVLLALGNQVDEISDLNSRDKPIYNWTGGLSLLIASCLMCSYLNSMQGGQVVRFHCAGRDQPITIAFALENRLKVSDEHFDADGDAAGIAMRIMREVGDARAKWHTSGAV